jgi:hypothetical protein
MMNERIRTWLCPICNRRAEFRDLFIDTYFQKILSQLSGDSDVSEVEIQPSGEWSIVQIKKETSKESQKNNFTLSGREAHSQQQTNDKLSSISSNDVNLVLNQQIKNNTSQPSTSLINNSNSNSTTLLTRVAKNLCTLEDTATRYANSLREMTRRILSINNNNNTTNNNDSNALCYDHQFNNDQNQNFYKDERGMSVENAIVLDSDSE